MKKTLLWMAGLGLLLSPLTLAAQAEPVRVDRDVECRWNGDRETYCETREFSLPARSRLEVDAAPNGGIDVRGWDRDEIRLIARVRAWSRDGDPESLARSIEVRTDDVIEARGERSRSRDGWSVSFDLMVPRGTGLRLESSNGGIELDGLTGEVYARTTNGGISLVGGEGRVRGETTNGGLDIELTGDRWKGDGVDLRTTNGGVRIEVPADYSAELETGTVNGGMEIDFPVTVQGRINRTLRTELGDGGALVRAKTTNGGVVIRRR
ncbi:MAG: DUF4097 family beta strand repeat-containing protein [Candidatus Longimicrobiales bacterium M2_2A_002]